MNDEVFLEKLKSLIYDYLKIHYPINIKEFEIEFYDNMTSMLSYNEFEKKIRYKITRLSNPISISNKTTRWEN